MAKAKPVNIKDDGTAPEILASAIVDIATGMRKLLDSRLAPNTIYLLVQNSVGKRRRGKPVPLEDIEAVLTAASTLDQKYLKQPGGSHGQKK